MLQYSSIQSTEIPCELSQDLMDDVESMLTQGIYESFAVRYVLKIVKLFICGLITGVVMKIVNYLEPNCKLIANVHIIVNNRHQRHSFCQLVRALVNKRESSKHGLLATVQLRREVVCKLGSRMKRF